MARIEISSGGLGIPVMDFQSELASYISDAESIISSFKTVRNSTYSLNGGVGELQNSLSSIESRIQEEETKKLEAENVQAKVTSLIQLSERIDRQVAANVNQSQDELYSINPWLRPTPSVNDEAPWYEQAWGWLCGKGEAIVDGVKKAWEWTKDTAVKAWNGIVEFYKDHKKIIDTILIVVGAIGAIAAVVFTGGLALVPLLGALGLSTATAIAISTAVAIIAVVSTVGSSILNLVDIWAEVDNPVFNFFQKAFNIVSAVSNLTYSIGNIYNSIKHITPQEYIANNPAATAQPQPTTAMFDDSVPVSQDKVNSPSQTRTPHGSEKIVEENLGGEYSSQVSINKSGMTAGSYGQEGTIRIDSLRGEVNGNTVNLLNVDDYSVIDHFDVAEVKNYSIETSAGRSNLLQNVAKQAAERNSVLKQAGASVAQTYYIDTVGHNIPIGKCAELYEKLTALTPNNVDIFFMWK